MAGAAGDGKNEECAEFFAVVSNIILSGSFLISFPPSRLPYLLFVSFHFHAADNIDSLTNCKQSPAKNNDSLI